MAAGAGLLQAGCAPHRSFSPLPPEEEVFRARRVFSPAHFGNSNLGLPGTVTIQYEPAPDKDNRASLRMMIQTEWYKKHQEIWQEMYGDFLPDELREQVTTEIALFETPDVIPHQYGKLLLAWLYGFVNLPSFLAGPLNRLYRFTEEEHMEKARVVLEGEKGYLISLPLLVEMLGLVQLINSVVGKKTGQEIMGAHDEEAEQIIGNLVRRAHDTYIIRKGKEGTITIRGIDLYHWAFVIKGERVKESVWEHPERMKDLIDRHYTVAVLRSCRREARKDEQLRNDLEKHLFRLLPVTRFIQVPTDGS